MAAIRLVKIAKELNVGTSTIVDFLKGKGYDIENKPTSKISDEMHDELLLEFSDSMAAKEKADKLVIGSRYENKEEKPAPPVVKVPEPAPAPVVVKVPAPAPEPEPVKEVVIPEVKVEPAPTPVVKIEVPKEVEEKIEAIKEIVAEKEEAPKRLVPGIKVLGKIDLSTAGKPPKKAKKEEPKKEATPEVKSKEKPKAVTEKPVKVEETPKPATKETTPTKGTKAPVVEEMMRAKTPSLAGLKIQGKIDLSTIQPDKKPKKDTKKAEVDRKKRKRKKIPAKGVPATGGGSNRAGSNRAGSNRAGSNRAGSNRAGSNRGGTSSRGSSRRDEVKEVTQKEIDDKIKATLARLSGGGKNKRSKIRRDNRDDKKEKQEIKDLEAVETTLKVTEFISVSELASLMEKAVTEVIMTCMSLGVIVSINQRLDAEVIELVASEFGFEVEFIGADEDSEEEEEIIDDPADLMPRAPIVTVMGHVDHGKTSLLDFIRNANVADGEAGGITQHIGAYEVVAGPDKKKVTFLDTPGHEAFTAMRARGAKVTDVAIIIVAADDKIMPQTKEAISHAQAAGVPIVFAINKIDKDGADPERIKAELAQMNFQVEDWGGTYQSQDISAKKGENIDKLLEKVLLESELLELKANPSREAHGTVIEASLDKGKGYVTKMLVQNGTLRVGDSMVAGSHSGKVKAMFNEKGKRVKEAGPSAPVLVLGLSGAPQAGEKFKIMESEQEARQLATKRSQIEREQSNRASKRISLDEIGRRLALGSFKELNLIVKGDVDGSIEALSDALIKQSVESIQVNVIHKAVGQIVESDILLASASDAIIIGFQVRPSSNARQLAEREGVEIKTYSIIYEAIEEIKLAMEGMLEPTKEEKIQGQVEVRETYKISKIGTIAGCYVTEGKIYRNSHIRIIRDGIVVYPTKEGVVGEISGLKRFKDDAKEVKFGFECGITIKNFNDIKAGDIIEPYEIIEVKQTLKGSK
ncbi:MAG: translation initiation factor IF-2 [Saprospiraceae bacterium]|jgi:translation initiation factor IF-2